LINYVNKYGLPIIEFLYGNLNEDEAINEFINTLDDNDKTHEENFDVFDIENLGIPKQEDY
jgi:hypothetical protein